jgi:hypothetical protein
MEGEGSEKTFAPKGRVFVHDSRVAVETAVRTVLTVLKPWC